MFWVERLLTILDEKYRGAVWVWAQVRYGYGYRCGMGMGTAGRVGYGRA